MIKNQKITKVDHKICIPDWHFEMMNDEYRNQKFQEALNCPQIKGKNVFEIGTGSGLLAMMAIQNGAKKVYSCEYNKKVFDISRSIIQKNGFVEKIELFNKLSTQIDNTDICEEIDFIITETFDCALIGEGALVSIQDAVKKFTNPNLVIIPYKASLSSCLIESNEINNLFFVDRKYGLDLSDFNLLSPQKYVPIHLKHFHYNTLAKDQKIFEFFFKNLQDINFQNEVTHVSKKNGILHGIVVWFEIYLEQDNMLSNHYSNNRTHWQQAFIHFSSSPTVKKDSKITITYEIKENQFTASIKSIVNPQIN